MSAANGSAIPGDNVTEATKAKGKAAADPESQNPGMSMSMDEDEDSSEEESGIEESNVEIEEADEDEDNDNMEEIDTSNILGQRTRGKAIDYVEAEKKAKDAGDTLPDDDDEEDDDDFEDAGQQDGPGGVVDKMEEY